MESTKERALFDGGIGTIVPDKSPLEIEPIIIAYERPIEDAAVVCIDGRASVERQPVREKVAGGNLNTFLYAAAASEWNGFSQDAVKSGPQQMALEAADFLTKSKEKLGAHTQTQNHGHGTGCGAVDKAHEISVNIANHAGDWAPYAEAILGDMFDGNTWSMAQAGYRAMAEDPLWQGWKTSNIQDIVEKFNGVVCVLENNVGDPNHGHNEQAIHINFKDGHSNDRDDSSMQYFEVDVAPIIRMSEKASASLEDYTKLIHAMVMRQLGTAYQLTKNQHIFITR